MRVKVTSIHQFNDTSMGYEAHLHTAGVTVEFWKALTEYGYSFDFTEESEENGYDECTSIFSEMGSNKAEFEKDLKAVVKSLTKTKTGE